MIEASVKLLEFDRFLDGQEMPHLRPFPGSEPEKPPDWDGFQDCVDDTAGDAEMAARLATTPFGARWVFTWAHDHRGKL